MKHWMHGILTAAGICALLAPVASAQVNAYGTLDDAPIAFAMATAGQWTGNGIGLFSGDNRVLHNATSFDQVNTGASASAEVATYVATPGNTAVARSFATFGVIRLYAHMQDSNPVQQEPSTTAIADAGWLDRITIFAPGLNGQAGVLNFSLFVSGNLDADSPRGGASMQIGVDSPFGVDDAEVWQAGADNHIIVGEGPVAESVPFSVNFTYGTPFLMSVRGLAAASTASRDPVPGSSALADFYNTVNWNGIQSITAGGAPVSGYSITSASGVDYTQSFAAAAAPEPGTMALLGAALAALGIGAVRRRHRARRS